ncbi:hypothetical protein Aple_023670 [Acrocarpospora pleiomorpha]|uniref:Acyl-CoA dehydrogenase/oxidase C-terminal domain-containing protein n=1 Tax=Acrocarpospora pleiomorpha TaxID=90975 RepID=A0A5M3XIF2_9ACTN|nr:acyl-CoA dehydrogenase family protein [Acrocarpospora pleiomorpha]GES19471.1 hypothetical protein Aple_023670 [Acrocarpospora pleiomorpha]
MFLELSSDEHALMDALRTMSHRLGPDAGPDRWSDALTSSGYCGITVTDGDSALQASCASQIIGEVLAPLSLAGILTLESMLGPDAAMSPGGVLDEARSAWRRGERHRFALAYQTAPGRGMAELLGPEPDLVVLCDEEGARVARPGAVELGEPSGWTGMPAVCRASWDAAATMEEIAPPPQGTWNDLNLLLHASELLGLVRTATERTIEYVKQRHQFGRPLAANQVIAHRVVDVVTEMHAVQALLEYAAWAWGDGRSAPESGCWAHAAFGLTSEWAVKALREAFQFHGGMSMTAELWLHHWFRRGNRLANFQGDATAHFAKAGTGLMRGASLAVPIFP